MRTRVRRVAIAALAGCAIGGCDRTVTGPSAGPPPAAPRPVSVAIAGQGVFTAPGQTEQLTLRLRLSDKSEIGGLEGVVWTSTRPRIASVASDGLVTALDLGAGRVTASFVSQGLELQAGLDLVVTPEGTFVNGGRVREPGRGSLENVELREVGTAIRTTTESGGAYNIGGLTTGILRVDIPGFEPVEHTAAPNRFDDDIPVQRIVRVQAGESASLELTPNDTSHEVQPGVRCRPCKRIRVVAPEAGTADIELTWGHARSRLGLWWNGRFHEPPADSQHLVVTVPLEAGENIAFLAGTLLTSPVDPHVPVRLSVSGLR